MAFSSTPRDGSTSGIYLDCESNSHDTSPGKEDYMVRRWSRLDIDTLDALGFFQGVDQSDKVPLDAVVRLPLSMQVAFRRKMLAIFALQLLAVSATVALTRFHPAVVDLVHGIFRTNTITTVIAVLAGVASVILLVVLYIHREKFPLNWLLLLLFTAAQTLCLVALGVALESHVMAFNCGFTLACVVLMLALSGLRLHPTDINEHELLVSTFGAGLMAFATVTLVSCVLLAGSKAFDFEFLSTSAFGISLLLQLLLVLWFAFDASSMYYVVTPDEYMRGVVFFYADLLQLCVVVTAALVSLLLCDLSDSAFMLFFWADCCDATRCCCTRQRPRQGKGVSNRDELAVINTSAIQRV